MTEKEEKTPKVWVAIYDNDFRIKKIQKYPISEDGKKIRIQSGGSGHWMPDFTASSFLEFPSLKKFLLFGERQYKRVYIVPKKGEACVDFETGTAKGPSSEELKKAVGATMLRDIGKDRNAGPKWYHYITMLFVFLCFIMLLQLGGFVR